MSLTLYRRRGRRAEVATSLPAHAAAGRLVRDIRFELVPLKTAVPAIAQLPPASPTSVTCSPTKGIAATLDLTARLRDLGHDAVPHLAARLLDGHADVTRLAAWCRDHGVTDVFVVGGDSPAPRGPYGDALEFLRDLLDAAGGDLRRVGIAAYPDGHVLIERPRLRDALLAKQTLLEEAGVAGYATTQMCFQALQIRAWLATERLAGLRLPVHVGLPGVVDRRRLLTMGMRVGVGASLRYVKKNAGMLGSMLTGGRYDPTGLVDAIAAHAAELGIDGLHSFTFNSVGPTAVWRERCLVRHQQATAAGLAPEL